MPLPSVRVELSLEQVVERLRTASRRGRLPGFRAGGDEGALFAVAAHGHPFDADLLGSYTQASGGGGSGGVLRFSLRFHRRMPIIFAVVLLVTVWPGVYFMDELIAQYLPDWWRPWVTYWWYLPLTILPLPWAWRTLMRRSRATTSASAHEAIQKIAAETGGRIEA
jgi:hypothetical protein